MSISEYFTQPSEEDLSDKFYIGHYKNFKYNDNDTEETNSEVKMSFIVPNSITYYTVFPDSWAMALTNIGGLLALLRLFTFLNWYHEWKFEKYIERSLA